MHPFPLKNKIMRMMYTYEEASLKIWNFSKVLRFERTVSGRMLTHTAS